MIWLLISSMLLAMPGTGPDSERVLCEFSWQKLKDAGQLASGEIVAGSGSAPAEQLRIENSNGVPTWITVVKIARPALKPPAYAITGEVRTQGVEGTAYLEMCSHFSDDRTDSVQTLGSGLIGPLEGTRNWRPFALPLALDEGSDGPVEVVLNMVLPSRGTVYLGAVRLVQYQQEPESLANPNGMDRSCRNWTIWLSVLVVVLLAGHTAASVIVIRRGGRCRVVGWFAIVGQLLGAGLLAGGIYGFVRGSFPLNISMLVLGSLYLGVMWGLMPSIHKRRELFNLQQLSSMDVWSG